MLECLRQAETLPAQILTAEVRRRSKFWEGRQRSSGSEKAECRVTWEGSCGRRQCLPPGVRGAWARGGKTSKRSG